MIELLLIELKEDNQALNQDEFIKAMNKLFESIYRKIELISGYDKYNIFIKQQEIKINIIIKE